MKIAIIIPCYNEERSILQVLKELGHLTAHYPNHEIVPIPVNDCSTDKTAEVLRNAHVPFINLPINLGIGGAVQTGFKQALAIGADISIQVDGDGQHPAGELPKLIDTIATGEYDIVIGSRFIDKTGFQSTFFRRLGITVIKNTLVLFTHTLVSDPTSGLRAYSGRALKLLAKDYPDDFPEPVALVPLLLSDLKVKEVPVEMMERTEGVSSIKSWKSIYYMLKVILAIFFTYLKYKLYGKRSTI
jgi:glycosyltransferase involved in cell wall biosynthesis